MRVVGRQRLNDFCRTHSDANPPVLAWLAEVEDADWQSPHEVKRRFLSVSMIGDRRVVFSLAGNRYRVDAKISYQLRELLIVRVGTHAEYDTWTF